MPWNHLKAFRTKVTDPLRPNENDFVTSTEINEKICADTNDVVFNLMNGVGKKKSDDLFLTLDGVSGASTNLAVNGAATTTGQVFSLLALASNDIIITDIQVSGVDGGIRMDRFFGTVAAISNGVLFERRNNDMAATDLNFLTTGDIARWSGRDFNIYAQTGADVAVAIREFQPALVIREAGSGGTDDFVRFTVRDNLTGIDDLTVKIRCFQVNAGAL